MLGQNKSISVWSQHTKVSHLAKRIFTINLRVFLVIWSPNCNISEHQKLLWTILKDYNSSESKISRHGWSNMAFRYILLILMRPPKIFLVMWIINFNILEHQKILWTILKNNHSSKIQSQQTWLTQHGMLL